MLDNLLNIVSEYVNKHKGLEAEVEKARVFMVANYNKQAYVENFAKLKGVYEKDVKKLYDEYREKTDAEFNDAKSKIRSLICAPTPQGMLNAISTLEQMRKPTIEEVKAIYEATKNNYLASKKVHDVFDFVNFENIIFDHVTYQYSNYIQQVKAFHDSNQIEPIFIPADHAIAEVDSLKIYVMNSIFKASSDQFLVSSYRAANVLAGEWIGRVQETVNKFCERYKA